MKRRGRPPSFSRADLIATARRLGPDGIGLKEVAAALGVSRTSLYLHVRDQDELGELVLGELISAADVDGWEPEGDAPWSAWLEAYARTLRRTLLAAGPWVRYATRRLYSLPMMAVADRSIGGMLADGLDLTEAVHAMGLVSELVAANVRNASGVDEPREEGRDEELQRLEAGIDSMPNLRQALEAMRRISYDGQFEYDLACALAGVRARLEARA